VNVALRKIPLYTDIGLPEHCIDIQSTGSGRMTLSEVNPECDPESMSIIKKSIHLFDYQSVMQQD
jgi:DNA-binding transcriptional regulator YdaS (Cro superfamily)